MRRGFHLFLIATFLAVVSLAWPPFATPAIAQDTLQAPNYETWEKVASRAEIAFQEQRASTSALESLREELVDWRSVFLDAQTTHESRIATIRNQITSLGAAPVEGAPEIVELTERRATLSAQLAALEAPVRAAEEAYSRANGLISEADQIFRDRQTEKLFELGPIPLNPLIWPDAAKSVSTTFKLELQSVEAAAQRQTNQNTLRENLPATLLYLIVALGSLARGQMLIDRFSVRLIAGAKPQHRRLIGFVLSLGLVLVPYVGTLALAEALHSTGLMGFRGQLVADALPEIALAYFGAHWLGLRLFPYAPTPNSLRLSSGETSASGRVSAAVLGLLYGLNRLIIDLSAFESYSEATQALLHFPIVVLAGIFLFRMGRVLRKAVDDAPEGAGVEKSFRIRTIDFAGRALFFVGICGPALAAVGYLVGSQALVFPAIISLGLIGALIILSGVMRDAYAVFSHRNEDSSRDALIPVLLTLALTFSALPVFALIWGARVADLAEIWARFLKGFEVGDSRISPTDFLTFAVVFAIGYVLTRMLQSTLRGSVLPKTSIDPGGQTAIVSGLGYVGIFLAAIIGISTAGIDLSSLAIVAGALSVGIGFGLQNIVSNFVSGIILLIERPITEGDWISVNGHEGYVRDISVRSTRIETFNRSDVIIPNADLVSGAVTNFTRGNLVGRAIVPVGVAYGTDTRKVEKILQEIAEAHPLVSLNPTPAVHFVGFGADSMDFEIRAILRDVNFIMSVQTDFNHEIAKRFAEEGIEIPFAQRDVWLRNPEALIPAAAKKNPKSPA